MDCCVFVIKPWVCLKERGRAVTSTRCVASKYGGAVGINLATNIWSRMVDYGGPCGGAEYGPRSTTSDALDAPFRLRVPGPRLLQLELFCDVVAALYFPTGSSGHPPFSARSMRSLYYDLLLPQNGMALDTDAV